MDNTSESLTISQLKTINNAKMKAIISLEQAKNLVTKGFPYTTKYNTMPYLKGYFISKFNTFNDQGNPKEHLAQFKVTCGNTQGNNALLICQFFNNLTSITFEQYTKLLNDWAHIFVELETLVMKRFANIVEKVTIIDLTLMR